MDYELIKQALRKLRESPTAISTVFGASVHRFRVNTPLSFDQVDHFEKQHDISLPEDYRGFLLNVGDGGAGPYYGMFKLGYFDGGGSEDEAWTEEGFLVGKLSREFPFTDPWNDVSRAPIFDNSKGDDPTYLNEYEREFNEFEKDYWRTTDGALPICHIGCALRQWLVISGTERDCVWCDFRADQRGWLPQHEPGRTRVTFSQWYGGWLDEALVYSI